MDVGLKKQPRSQCPIYKPLNTTICSFESFVLVTRICIFYTLLWNISNFQSARVVLYRNDTLIISQLIDVYIYPHKPYSNRIHCSSSYLMFSSSRVRTTPLNTNFDSAAFYIDIEVWYIILGLPEKLPMAHSEIILRIYEVVPMVYSRRN